MSLFATHLVIDQLISTVECIFLININFMTQKKFHVLSTYIELRSSKYVGKKKNQNERG